MRNGCSRLFLWVVTVWMMCSCMSHHTSAVVDTPPEKWYSAVQLDYPNCDTLENRNVNLLTFYSTDSPKSITLVVEVTSPDGYKAIDTVTCNLPKEKHGRNYFEQQTTFRTGTVMRHTGNYKVTITPTDTLRGVWAVGLNTIYDNGKR